MEVLVKTMKPTSIISMLLTLLSLSACGINHSLAQDNDVKAAFADVLDLYYTRIEMRRRCNNTREKVSATECTGTRLGGQHARSGCRPPRNA
jgi:hypothetical protein